MDRLIDTDYYFTASDDDSIPSSDNSHEFERLPGSQTYYGSDRTPYDRPERGGRPGRDIAHPPMCIICGVRPQYSDGLKSYPTCGLACAAKLKDIQGGPGSSAATDICVVCHARPKYSRGGKSYPTCGLTCAAKLNPRSGPVEMCDYCHKRPKYFDGKKTYPQCGRTCRDKARRLAASRSSSEPTQTLASNSSCLMCWKAPRRGDSHFCGKSCSDAASQRAPLLLEAPRGHVTFERVANSFVASWRRTGVPSPEVKKVYKIIQKPVYASDYAKYRTQVDPNGSRSTGKGNEFKRWHGIARECDIGSGGNVKPCSSRTCSLCQIMHSTFDAARFPGGAIHTSMLSDKADQHSKSPRQYSSQAILLVNVAAGKAMKVTRSQLQASSGVPRGYDSLQVVSSLDGKSIVEDLIVYRGDAIRPSYLVIYG